MTRDELFSAVCEQLRAELPLGEHQLREHDELTGLPGSESVHLLRVAARLERRFDVEFEDIGLFSASTIGDLVDVLAGSLRTQGLPR